MNEETLTDKILKHNLKDDELIFNRSEISQIISLITENQVMRELIKGQMKDIGMLRMQISELENRRIR